LSRIALIHALEESAAPTRDAFARNWPEAFAFDILDTSLAIDRAHAGSLDTAMLERFSTLAQYAESSVGKGGRTSAILFTCSAFGPAIDRVKTQLKIPVLRPNESAFRQALARGRQIGLVVTFAPSAVALESELRAMADTAAQAVSIKTVLVEPALTALKAGDGTRHDRLVADAVGELAGFDVLVLGQFSMARAAPAVATAGFAGRVITTPDAAVNELRQLLPHLSDGSRQ
jgi:Asp/Glu/hydantoin racemase